MARFNTEDGTLAGLMDMEAVFEYYFSAGPELQRSLADGVFKTG